MSTVLSDVIGRGLHSAIPAAGVAGRLFYETDTLTLFRDNGATWDSVEAVAGVADILDLATAEDDDTLVLAPDGMGGVEFRAETAGIVDQGAFTYLDATGASAPGNPASGSARIYAKTDGRVYSRDNGGTEYGPFDAVGAGGVDLSAFRLAGVADDPGDIALGTYGDEFEYATPAALAAVWPAVNASALVYPAGSAAYLTSHDGCTGIARAITVPTNCEIAVLISGNLDTGDMFGVGFVEDTGPGPCFIGYYGTSYIWDSNSSYGYGSHGGGGSLPASYGTLAPFWLSIRKIGTDYSAKHSVNGSSWTASISAEAHASFSPTHIFIGLLTSNQKGGVMIHRVVYGSPTL